MARRFAVRFAGDSRRVKLPVALLWSRLMPAALACLLAMVPVSASEVDHCGALPLLVRTVLAAPMVSVDSAAVPAP